MPNEIASACPMKLPLFFKWNYFCLSLDISCVCKMKLLLSFTWYYLCLLLEITFIFHLILPVFVKWNYTRYYLCLSLQITFIFHLILPLSLPLFVDPPLEQSPATTLQLPDEEGHDVVALLFEESKTSGAEENLKM